MQDSNTEQLIFDVPTIIENLSACMTLYPGDLLVTGTPSGVGAGRNPKQWMRVGDRCEVEIERIGVLHNTVAAAD